MKMRSFLRFGVFGMSMRNLISMIWIKSLKIFENDRKHIPSVLFVVNHIVRMIQNNSRGFSFPL
jgi:hypothetical protein